MIHPILSTLLSFADIRQLVPSTNNRYITTNHKFYDKENSEQVAGKINPQLITTSANSKLGLKTAYVGWGRRFFAFMLWQNCY